MFSQHLSGARNSAVLVLAHRASMAGRSLSGSRRVQSARIEQFASTRSDGKVDRRGPSLGIGAADAETRRFRSILHAASRREAGHSIGRQK